MNFSLIDSIIGSRNAVLATVLSTQGHTYKKSGHKALFEADEIVPVYGNLGSLCADRDIISAAAQARESGKPRRIKIDTANETDIHLGYGAYCGGVMEILLEPVLERHKAVYAKLRPVLAGREKVFLVHDLDSGELGLEDTAPEPTGALLVEEVPPLRRVYVVGATPLGTRLARGLQEADFQVEVLDWRPAFLDLIERIPCALVEESFPFDRDSFVVILSHSFQKDLDALRAALDVACDYVGLLSSRKRRDKMFELLQEDGVSQEALKRVHSPVGLDIGGESDAEISVSIIAEVVRHRKR